MVCILVSNINMDMVIGIRRSFHGNIRIGIMQIRLSLYIGV